MKTGTTSAKAAYTFLDALLHVWPGKTMLPKHRQLYDAVRSAIQRGDARPGLQLPSTRDCATALGIGRNTAIRAYEQLLDEGYIETRQGEGSFVSSVLPDVGAVVGQKRTGSTRFADLSARAQTIVSRMNRPSVPRRKKLVSLDPARRAFIPAADLAAFPWKAWHQLVNRHLRVSDLSRFQPTESGGDSRLKAALAEHLRLARAVRCDEGEILITTGAQQALLLIALALCNPGDIAWIEDPGHEGARAALTAAGVEAVPVPVDEEGLAWHDGLPIPRLILVTPSHQYPLGSVLSTRRRHELLDVAARFGAWIVEDDYDGEFRHTDTPLPSLQGLDTAGQVIYLGTFGRALYHRLRLAYIVLPKQISEDVHRLHVRLFRDPPPVEQEALADFIMEGRFAAHIRRMRVIYRRRRNMLCRTIAGSLGARVQTIGTDAGVHVVLRLPQHVDDVDASRALADAGLDVLPLSAFYIGKPLFPGLILAFGGVDEATLALATYRLCEVLKGLLENQLQDAFQR